MIRDNFYVKNCKMLPNFDSIKNHNAAGAVLSHGIVKNSFNVKNEVMSHE